jgi:hypothetical protein
MLKNKQPIGVSKMMSHLLKQDIIIYPEWVKSSKNSAGKLISSHWVIVVQRGVLKIASKTEINNQSVMNIVWEKAIKYEYNRFIQP